ncbi:MAG: hypothetical protein V1645_02910 [archaeon]
MGKDKKIRVLVGCPTSDLKAYCLKEYSDAIKSLTYKDYDILIVDNSKSQAYSKKMKSLGLNVMKDEWNENARERIVKSRNIIREKALNYDYLLSLEQDVIPPRDIIERMLEHKEKILTGIYFTYKEEGKTLVPLLWVKGDGGIRNLTEEEAMQDKTMEAEAAGLGCMLIAKEVLEKVKFRYEKESNSFDDMWFCQDVKEKGYSIAADTGIRCKHLIKKWSWQGIRK